MNNYLRYTNNLTTAYDRDKYHIVSIVIDIQFQKPENEFVTTIGFQIINLKCLFTYYCPNRG